MTLITDLEGSYFQLSVSVDSEYCSREQRLPESSVKSQVKVCKEVVIMPAKRASELCGNLGEVDRNGYNGLGMSVLSELSVA